MKKGLQSWRLRVMMILAIVGPGFITANVDNDAGGIFTYSQCGGQFGYGPLWIMLPMTLALIIVQEMSARMGAVTGKGLSDLVREEFGLRLTFLMMGVILIANFGNVIAEFAGIAGSTGLFGVSRYISVPLCALLVWLMVVKGNYKNVEKIFLVASCFYVAYLVAGVYAKPDWGEAAMATLRVPHASVFKNSDYLYMIIGVVGTTIAPWMQFYLQSSIVEKGIDAKQYKTSRWDVIVGCVFTDVVAWFIVVACAATIFLHGDKTVNSAADAAAALKPLAGKYASILFSAGLFNASLFAASILPLSTAYTVCEGLGFESGVDKKFDEAKVFYWLYTVLIVTGAGVILLPQMGPEMLVKISIFSQFINGAVLPFVLIAMIVLINRRDVMGKYVNGRFYNIISWSTTAILIGLTVAMLWGMAHGS